jgi:hypothetical protein
MFLWFSFQQAVKKDSGGGCGRLDGISDDTDFELWDSRFMLRGDHEPEIGYKHARYALAIYAEGALGQVPSYMN